MSKLLLSVAAITSVCLVLGIAAALFGGPLSGLGSGAGGLAGVPSLVLLGLTAVGIVAGVRARSFLLVLGPAFVFLSYFQAAHVIEPCTSGRWDMADTFRGERVCGLSSYGPEIAERFHLLLHAVPGAAAAAVVVAFDRGRARRAGDPVRTSGAVPAA